MNVINTMLQSSGVSITETAFYKRCTEFRAMFPHKNLRLRKTTSTVLTLTRNENAKLPRCNVARYLDKMVGILQGVTNQFDAATIPTMETT